MKFTITWFGIDPEGHAEYCGYDILQINDDVEGKNRMVGMFCGCKPVPTIVSDGNVLWVKFVSDNNIHWPGFLASFEAISKYNSYLFLI